MSRRAGTILGIAHLFLALPIGAAFAAEPAGKAAPVATAPPAASPLPVLSRPSAQPLSADEMAAISGGTAVTNINTLSQQQLTATTTGNTITAGVVNSGAVTFSPQALAGFNGVGNFVINTGANNSLQGAINLSIVTAPAT